MNIPTFLRKAASGQFHISPDETVKLLEEKKAVLLDIRERPELEEGIAEPADWVPTSAIKANAAEWTDYLSKVDKSKTVVIYCAAGVRARHVANLMEQQGFSARVLGGFCDWADAGLPVKKFPA